MDPFVGDEVVRVPLSGGLFALVDAVDAHLICGFKWRSQRRNSGLNYALAGSYPRITYMHRLIIGAPAGKLVDHINGDGLDNRRANLRLCSHTENIRNQGIRTKATKTSRFKGVSYLRSRRKWSAEIEQNGEKLFLGLFDDEVHAARCYDAAAKVFHGRFARTNRQLGLLTEEGFAA